MDIGTTFATLGAAMKSRVGAATCVIVAILLLGIVYSEKIANAFRSDQISLRSDGIRKPYLDRVQTIKRSPPPSQLHIAKLCKGYLPEEFGFDRPTPKLILFFNSPGDSPEIVTARLSNLISSDEVFDEINTISAKDVWHANDYNYELSTAEHGSLTELAKIDEDNGTRRYDNLLEEAAFLCTQGVRDPIQQEIEMDEVIEEIEETATAYVSIEWPIENKEASLDIYYESQKQVHRSKLELDLRIL